MKTFVLLVILAVTGCATTSKTYGPDGREAFVIDCSGLALTWGMCYEKAGDLCEAHGYEVLTEMSSHGVHKNLLIQCRP
jgi:hypothetical protein